MSNDINELRTHLFDTLRGLKTGEVQLETAQAINATAQTIINSVKVEIEHVKVAGGKSAFIDGGESIPSIQSTRTATGTKTVTQLPGGRTVTQHKLA